MPEVQCLFFPPKLKACKRFKNYTTSRVFWTSWTYLNLKPVFQESFHSCCKNLPPKKLNPETLWVTTPHRNTIFQSYRRHFLRSPPSSLPPITFVQLTPHVQMSRAQGSQAICIPSHWVSTVVYWVYYNHHAFTNRERQAVTRQWPLLIFYLFFTALAHSKMFHVL